VRVADATRIVHEVAAAVGLAEGEAGVRSVLAALARLEPVSTRRLSRAVTLPVPIVASVCGELRTRRVVAEERPARLTSQGRSLFAAGGLSLGHAAACPHCAGRGVVLPGELGPLVSEIAKAVRHAPAARMDLDQCHCTVKTKLRRVLALHEADALVGRRLLLLGDDDLTSVAISRLVRRHGSPATVASLTVVDVDPAVVAFVRRALRDCPFPARCLEHDLRDPLPAWLLRSCDTVVTDPPYTVPAARLFLSRAADALDAPGGNVFLSFGSRRPGGALGLQRAIVETGFVIRRLVRDFNDYVGAGVLGGTSDLYHLAAPGELQPVVTGRFEGALYTAAWRGLGEAALGA
jgi:predicted methyltransferase